MYAVEEWEGSAEICVHQADMEAKKRKGFIDVGQNSEFL